METKTLPFEVKQLDEDEENFTFEGYLAAYENVDHGGDRIRKGAFSAFLKERNSDENAVVPVHWVHRDNEPIGVMPVKFMKEDNKGLFVKGLLPKDDTFVKGRVRPQMRVGSVRKMSIGYGVKDFAYDGDVRDLNILHLWEGSLVSMPMNEKADITDFKSVVPYQNLPLADRQRAWDADAAIGRVREWAGINGDGDLSDPDVQRKYRQAFFWYDDADQDLLGAYKLPFADVIEGTLTAVPRGVFAAAAAMRGARGGVYLPSQERPGVIRNIELYYDKMGLESPFGKSNILKVHDLTCIDERALEHILKTGVSFTGKLAPALVAAIKSAGLRDVDMAEHRDDAGNAVVLEQLDVILKSLKGGQNA